MRKTATKPCSDCICSDLFRQNLVETFLGVKLERQGGTLCVRLTINPFFACVYALIKEHYFNCSEIFKMLLSYKLFP